jgi:protoheme IX farnesyltransferase
MLPVVKGEARTARSIVGYSIVLVGISLLPFLWHTVGFFYLASALVLGLAFVALAIVLKRQTTPANARRLFSYSLLYLALLFVAMALDPILG